MFVKIVRLIRVAAITIQMYYIVCHKNMFVKIVRLISVATITIQIYALHRLS